MLAERRDAAVVPALIELLEKSAETTQVIVMTCHPEHYVQGKKARSANSVDLRTVIRRTRSGSDLPEG